MKLIITAAAALAAVATPALAQHRVVTTTTSRTTHVVSHGDRWHWKSVCRQVRHGHHFTRVCTRQHVRY